MKKYLVAGLLVWLPLAITIWVLSWLLGVLDGMFTWLLGLTTAVLPASTHALIAALAKIPAVSGSGANQAPNLAVVNMAKGWVMATKLKNMNSSNLVSLAVAVTVF